MAGTARFVRLASIGVLSLMPLAALLALDARSARKQPLRFSDPQAQAAEFIGYSRTIRLTPRQREIWEAALGSMPSPCCTDFRLSTCCCPCNLAKSSWGLANFLIARRGATAAEAQEGVRSWIAFVNPSGFSGDVCVSSGGCARKFADNGCGGMDEGGLHDAHQ
jgi:hypothetical protein